MRRAVSRVSAIDSAKSRWSSTMTTRIDWSDMTAGLLRRGSCGCPDRGRRRSNLARNPSFGLADEVPGVGAAGGVRLRGRRGRIRAPEDDPVAGREAVVVGSEHAAPGLPL